MALACIISYLRGINLWDICVYNICAIKVTFFTKGEIEWLEVCNDLKVPKIMGKNVN